MDMIWLANDDGDVMYPINQQDIVERLHSGGSELKECLESREISKHQYIEYSNMDYLTESL